MMKNVIPVIFFILIIAFRVYNSSEYDAESILENDGIITVAEDNKEMNLAIEEARKTFPVFLERMKAPQPTDSNFAIKVKISDENGDEHFWLSDITFNGEKMTGTIDNIPNTVKTVKEGQRYTFTKDEVSDWTYFSNNKMQGNRTLFVLLKQMPKEEADIIRAQLNL